MDDQLDDYTELVLLGVVMQIIRYALITVENCNRIIVDVCAGTSHRYDRRASSAFRI